MKLKFISNGGRHDYLTDRAVYKVFSEVRGHMFGAWIVDDDGDDILVIVEPRGVCGHSGGYGHFEILEENV